MKRIHLVLALLVLALPVLAQTPPPSNPWWVFDGSADGLARYNLKQDGLYMVYRPDLVRGLATVEDWSFVVQDLNTATKETVTLEIRKDDTTGLPGVANTDLVWSATFTNIDFSNTPTPGLGSFVVTPRNPIKLPSTEEAYWFGFKWPLMPSGPSGPTDGMVIQASGQTNTTGCIEAPRGYASQTNPFKGDLCAGIDFSTTTPSAGKVVSNMALFSMPTFTEPSLQAFASNYGYNTQAGNINFCTYNTTSKTWMPAPQSQPENNFGYAGVWPDVNDFEKIGRKDNFGWWVNANQLATNGGVTVLFLSDQTFDPTYIQVGWGTLFLSPISRWFSLVTLIAPLKTDLTTTPPSAWSEFGPIDMGAARLEWVVGVGPLHAQAVVVDGKNPNNILFTNMTTMYFDWIGSSRQVLDNNTGFKDYNIPAGARKATVHSERGYLDVQAELNNQPIGPKVTINPGCTKQVFTLPTGGKVKVSLGSKSKGAILQIKFE